MDEGAPKKRRPKEESEIDYGEVTPAMKEKMIMEAQRIEDMIEDIFHGRFSPSHRERIAERGFWSSKDEFDLLSNAENCDESNCEKYTTKFLELARALRQRAGQKVKD